MGRPLNKKYFGNTNASGLGGESLSSVTIGGTNNNYTAVPTLTVAAPTSPGGVTATAVVSAMTIVSAAIVSGGTGYTDGDVLTVVGGTGTAATLTITETGGVIDGVTVTTGGSYSVLPTGPVTVTGGSGASATFNFGAAISTVSVTNPGSGYVSVPTVTPSTGNATLTAVLTTTGANAFTVSAWVTGDNQARAADIVRQVSGRRYKVTTSAGTSTCALVARAPAAAGEMRLLAVDSAGGTYYVTKITSRKATLALGAGVTGTQFLDGQSVPWTLSGAVLNQSVVIQNA